MLSVACVLKSGPEYRVEHVVALRDGVRRHLSLDYKFACLSDLPAASFPSDVDVIPLRHGWPGWWSKLELLAPGQFDGPVFYLDLDTIVVGPLDGIVLGHRFTVLRNFWNDKRIGSGLMAWDCDLSVIYEKFKQHPTQAMERYRTPEKWGDQGFIKFHTPIRPDLWQVRFPGAVRSYKRDHVAKGGISPGTRILCFHGQPRPWDVPDLWMRYIKGELLV